MKPPAKGSFTGIRKPIDHGAVPCLPTICQPPQPSVAPSRSIGVTASAETT